MFTRSMFTTHDIIAQHQLLTRVAQLIDDNTIRTTLGEHFGAINAANLQKRTRKLKPVVQSARLCWRGFNMSDSEVISIIAVLKARPGKIDALKQALQALLLPTHRGAGQYWYALFQLRDTPDVFYVRESGAVRPVWTSISPCPISRRLFCK